MSEIREFLKTREGVIWLRYTIIHYLSIATILVVGGMMEWASLIKVILILTSTLIYAKVTL